MNNTKNASPDFLIIGLQKSGTYWLTALLDSHPEISCFPVIAMRKSGVGEGHFFDILGSIDKDGGERFRRSFAKKHFGFFADLVPLLDKMNRENLFRKFAERYSEFCGLQREKRLLGEKTVEYVDHLGLINQLYPGIKKICILRDPKDRIVSYYLQEQRKGVRETADLNDAMITDYLKQIESEYAHLLDYNGSLHCLTYEELSTDAPREIRKFLQYLGASVSDEIIADMIANSDLKRYKALERFVGERVLKFRQWVYILFRFLGRRPANRIAYRAGRRFYRILCMLFDRFVWKKGAAGVATGGGRSHYGEGAIGDWMNYFTDEQSRRVDSALAPLHRRLRERYNVAIGA